MNKNYLITGGLGLIGSALANSLKGNICVISRTAKHKNRIKKETVKVHTKDLQNITTKDLENIDIIYHCASTTDNYNIFTDPYRDTNTNIVGTIHLLEECKKLKRRPKIVYLSTFYVYGNTYDLCKKPLNEHSLVNPLGSYPVTKYTAEKYIELYGQLFSIPYLIVRLTNVYGPDEDYDNPQKGALNYLIMEALKGNDIPLYKGGRFHRDYIFIDDVIKALKTIEKKENEIFVVGSGKSIEFKKIVTEALELSRSTSKIKNIPSPPFHKIVGVNNFAADIRKIKKLGWKPKVSIEQGIKQVITHYKSLMRNE